MRKRLQTLLLLLALTPLGRQAFAQSSANVNSWQISPSDLTNGKLVITAGETKSITYSVTVNKSPSFSSFDFNIGRMAAGMQSCGCEPISVANSIVPSDFGSNETVTKQYTVSVTAARGSSGTGSTLRNGDKILFVFVIPTYPGFDSPSKTYAVTVLDPPVANNTISNPGTSKFYDMGNSAALDPAALNGSTPTGGDGTVYNYTWQSSTTSSTSGFSDVATGKNFDPPPITRTTYYRRLVTSGTAPATSTSNVITITVMPYGATIDNPFNIGNINCAYSNLAYNSPEYGYGNEYGNSTDDVFYKFNLTAGATVSINNCKQDGVSGNINLLDASGNAVPGATPIFSCDVGIELVYVLQPGVYYIVSEGAGGPIDTNYLPMSVYVRPTFTTSPDVTITAGASTTLSASGSGLTYIWSPATGLSSTTGASVIASPALTTTYNVRGTSASGCVEVKSITVNVIGSVGSTFNNPIVANIGGCGYYSGAINPVGYGNDYGGPSDDVFFKFTLSSASQVSIDTYAGFNMHLVLLNSGGTFVDEQYYAWVDSGDDAGTYILVPADGTPLKPTLQPGTYYVVAEGTNTNGYFGVLIETPAGYGCRKATPKLKGSLQPSASTSTPDQIVDTNSQPAVDDLSIVSVYPNPANQYVSFHLEQDAPATIRIVNTNGVTVKEATLADESEKLNIDDLPNGLYVIKIIQQHTMRSEKMVIER